MMSGEDRSISDLNPSELAVIHDLLKVLPLATSTIYLEEWGLSEDQILKLQQLGKSFSRSLQHAASESNPNLVADDWELSTRTALDSALLENGLDSGGQLSRLLCCLAWLNVRAGSGEELWVDALHEHEHAWYLQMAEFTAQERVALERGLQLINQYAAEEAQWFSEDLADKLTDTDSGWLTQFKMLDETTDASEALTFLLNVTRLRILQRFWACLETIDPTRLREWAESVARAWQGETEMHLSSPPASSQRCPY